MRYTQVFVYAGLLMVALIAAYLTWTHEPPGGKGDVVVIDLEPPQLQSVVYEEPEHRVQVSRREGGDDGICWGDTRKLKDPPRERGEPPKLLRDGGDDDSADGGPDRAEEPEPDTPPESTE